MKQTNKQGGWLGVGLWNKGSQPNAERQATPRVERSVQCGSSTNSRSAFSLIEVTISIAITAVALVALMGMLPAGMKTMREAGDRAVETRINQQIIGELEMTEWVDLPNFHGNIRFYDDQGIELRDSNGGADVTYSHVYTARVQMMGAVDPDLQLVVVQVTSVIDEAFNSGAGFDNIQFTKQISNFRATIAKMGNNF